MHSLVCFFVNDPAATGLYSYLHTLSLHDALPISIALHLAPDIVQHIVHFRHEMLLSGGWNDQPAGRADLVQQAFCTAIVASLAPCDPGKAGHEVPRRLLRPLAACLAQAGLGVVAGLDSVDLGRLHAATPGLVIGRAGERSEEHPS